MQQSALKELLDVAAAGKPAEAKDAAKAIVANLPFGMPKTHMAQLAKLYVGTLASLAPGLPAHNLAALVSVLKVFAWQIKSDEQFDTLASFTLGAMTHPDGSVRQRARRAGEWLRMDLTLDTDAAYERHVRKVEALLAEHRPDDLPPEADGVYIEDLKPSAFKTLLMYWHDLGRGITGEKFVNPQRARQLRLPTYTYLDEDWLDEHELSPDEEASKLWAGRQQVDFAVVEAALDELQAGARQRLRQALAALGFPPGTLQTAERRIARDGSDGGLEVFMELVGQYAARSRDPRALAELSGVVRGIQSLANHYRQKNRNDQPISELLVSCALTKAEFGRQLPKDWQAFTLLLRDAHRAVDEFLVVQAGMPGQGIETYAEDDQAFQALAADIAHYALDWLAQSQPWSLPRRSPRQLAATAWYIVRHANAYPVGFTLQNLADFGGWKTPGSVQSTCSMWYYDVLHAMADPELLTFDGSRPGA